MLPSKPSTQPKLVIIEGKDKGKILNLEPGTTVIGRTKGDILLADSRVSRSHVALSYDERSGKLTFTDLKSLNGTLVNGETAENGPLVDGDRLQVGNTLFDCQLSESTDVADIKAKKTASVPTDAPLKELSEGSHGSLSLGRPEPAWASSLEQLDENPEPAPKKQPEPAPIRRSPSAQATSRWRSLSPRVRNSLLGLVLLAALSLLLSPDKSTPTPDLEREFATIEQLQREGRLDEAIEKAEQLAKAHSQHTALFATLGHLYEQRKQFEQAVRSFRRVTELDEAHPTALVRLIGLYLRLGIGKEADALLSKLDERMQQGPHSPEFFVEAAKLYLAYPDLTRSPEKAIILSQALQNEMAPDSSIGFQLEAQLMFQQGQNEQALAIIERGLKRHPSDEWLLENLAFAYLSMKDNDKAMAVVERWTKVHPDTSKALLVLAYLKFRSQDVLGALPPLQKIAEIGRKRPEDPHLPEALNLMGQVYQTQGQNAEAQGLFAQSCQLGFAPACAPQSENRAPTDESPAQAPPAADSPDSE